MTKINEPSEGDNSVTSEASLQMIKRIESSTFYKAYMANYDYIQEHRCLPPWQRYLTKQTEKMIELYDTAEPTVHWPKKPKTISP